MYHMNSQEKYATLGIDIGSTTVKIAILDEEHNILFSDYERHFANIRETLSELLKKAYEQLGERWGLLSYRTLSSILVQCLQKGSVGVEQILAKEAEQAQRLRRQQAQILGEQASTRLLFPMILMLLVVFVILLVPAWLTFAV